MLFYLTENLFTVIVVNVYPPQKKMGIMFVIKTQNDSFGYSSRSELVSASLGNDDFAYDFDEIGNRETANEARPETAYTANSLNQYSAVGDFVPAYDADGNATLIKTATGTWSVSYNAENRPVRFECAGTQTVVEMNYDYLGRRFEKKITVAGTTTSHHRYIYRGFLQIACLDLTRAGTPALWFVFWDPTQPTGTRPLAIQKNGTWFVYGHDLTKNVCEVFGSDGYIKTTYSYSPFGNVSSVGNFEQNFQWSSEFYDSELNLVYYNYRHYSPTTARWLSRDPIEEMGGLNLYAFAKNGSVIHIDSYGLIDPIWGGGCGIGNRGCRTDPNGTYHPPGPHWDDQINPFGCRGYEGEADYRAWFDWRFPGTMAAARAFLQEKISQALAVYCKTGSVTPISCRVGPTPAGEGERNYLGNFDNFGDETENWLEEHTMIGNFSVHLDFKITPIGNKKFAWSASAVVWEDTGTSLKDDDLFFFFAWLCKKRRVKMGEWALGSGEINCCNDIAQGNE